VPAFASDRFLVGVGFTGQTSNLRDSSMVSARFLVPFD
jgi:hypothetical protein